MGGPADPLKTPTNKMNGPGGNLNRSTPALTPITEKGPIWTL